MKRGATHDWYLLTTLSSSESSPSNSQPPAARRQFSPGCRLDFVTWWSSISVEVALQVRWDRTALRN